MRIHLAVVVLATVALLVIEAPGNVRAIRYLREQPSGPVAIWEEDCLRAAASAAGSFLPWTAVNAPDSLTVEFSLGPAPTTRADFVYRVCLDGARLIATSDDYAAAIDKWRSAPEIGEALAARAQILSGPEALQRAEAAAVIAPDSSVTVATLCAIRERTADPARALEACQAAIRQRPDDQVSRVLLALLLARNGDLRAALTVLNEGGLENGTVVWAIRGDAALATGNAAEAIDYLLKAQPGWPDNPYLAYQLGTAYAMTGNQRESRRWLTQALAIDPNFEPARTALSAAPVDQR